MTVNAEIQTKNQELEFQKNDMLARFDAMKAELENQQIENTARNQEIVNLNENLQLEVEKSEGFLVEGKQLEAQANGVVKQLEGENERLRVEIVELTEAKRVSLEDKDMAANESQMNSGVIEDLEEKLRTAEELLKASDDRLLAVGKLNREKAKKNNVKKAYFTRFRVIFTVISAFYSAVISTSDALNRPANYEGTDGF